MQAVADDNHRMRLRDVIVEAGRQGGRGAGRQAGRERAEAGKGGKNTQAAKQEGLDDRNEDKLKEGDEKGLAFDHTYEDKVKERP
jgi:hypothetical protein